MKKNIYTLIAKDIVIGNTQIKFEIELDENLKPKKLQGFLMGAIVVSSIKLGENDTIVWDILEFFNEKRYKEKEEKAKIKEELIEKNLYEKGFFKSLNCLVKEMNKLIKQLNETLF